ncbi:SCO family protein [Stakelama marina]|uniref:SCO family protein n=1 Tax=Stakelama marina TaxID=2826939 RepID=A0A8T4IEU0_9SPHN|nr:SCO family protein [Stakelama marina]MBR0552971.1 SCO family protein [Stakelama marina]
MAGAVMDHRNLRVFALAVALVLSGCGASSEPARDQAPPLAGASIGGPFTLVNQDGRTVTQADFAGKYRIMYFGYTYCPDVCPVDMQNLGTAMRDLDKNDPAISKKIVPIFVSVDPARDTPDVLKQFVSAFYPRLVGLTGSEDAIARTAKEYAIFFKKVPPSEGTKGYLVNHSTTAYLMSPNGDPIALVPVDESPDAVEAVLKRWVR